MENGGFQILQPLIADGFGHPGLRQDLAEQVVPAIHPHLVLDAVVRVEGQSVQLEADKVEGLVIHGDTLDANRFWEAANILEKKRVKGCVYLSLKQVCLLHC